MAPGSSDPVDHDAASDAAGQARLQELGRPAVSTAIGCPFLISESGGWRLAMPAREHRCSAFLPPTALAPEKQARLCLTAAHGRCATYLASVQAREARIGVRVVDRTTRWALARNTTVLEEAGGPIAILLSIIRDRRRWPAIPAVLLVTTLLTLALSGFRGGVPGAAVSTQGPTPGATPTPSATPERTPGPTGSPVASPVASPAIVASPTANATASPIASYRTYVVKSGDTLSGIAGNFGTTISAIVDLNGIKDPARLHVGQVLRIP